MMDEKKNITIALAQISVMDGDLEYNLKKHCAVIVFAA